MLSNNIAVQIERTTKPKTNAWTLEENQDKSADNDQSHRNFSKQKYDQ